MKILNPKFRPVKGYEGLYEINEKGEIWSLARTVLQKNGLVARNIRGHFMTLNRQKYNKDRWVCLSKDGKTKTMKVSNLIVEAFQK